MIEGLPRRVGEPANSFIDDVLESLERRRKALKHKAASIAIKRSQKTTDQTEGQWAEIALKIGKRQDLLLTVHEDRTIIIRAHESIWQVGWKFKYQNSGRFVGSESGPKVIAAIEASLSAMFKMTSADTGLLDSIWNPHLANGPRPI